MFHLSLSPLRSAWHPTSSVDTETGRAGDLDMETVITIIIVKMCIILTM